MEGRLLCPWDFPGKNTGVGCQFFSRGTSWPGVLHCKQIPYSLSCQGSLYHSEILYIKPHQLIGTLEKQVQVAKILNSLYTLLFWEVHPLVFFFFFHIHFWLVEVFMVAEVGDMKRSKIWTSILKVISFLFEGLKQPYNHGNISCWDCRKFYLLWEPWRVKGGMAEQ